MMNKIGHEGSAIENVLGDDETCQFKDAKDGKGVKGAIDDELEDLDAKDAKGAKKV